MPQQQERREHPKRFLDASLIPMEKALKGRADAIESRMTNLDPEFSSACVAASLVELAAEFRLLAEELYFW